MDQPIKFSFLSALGQSFSVVSSRPRAAISLIVHDLISLAVCGGIFVYLTFNLVQQSIRIREAGLPPEVGPSLLWLGGTLVLLVVGSLLAAVQRSAWYRLLTGQEATVFPAYRLGREEFRILVFSICKFALVGAVLLIYALIFVMPPFFSLVLFSESHAGDPAQTRSLVIGLTIIGLWGLGSLVAQVASARLEVGAVITVITKRLDVLAGWSATAGRSLQVILALLATYLMYVLGAILISVLAVFGSGVIGAETVPVAYWILLSPIILLTHGMSIIRYGIYTRAALAHRSGLDSLPEPTL